MFWKYDADWDILNVRLADGKIGGSTKLSMPEVIVDLADDGRVLALEILDASEQMPHINERPQGEVTAGSSPLWPFQLKASIGEESERLTAYVKHIITVLNALTSPVSV
jgi:uncharacterized protein YuzE